MQFYYEVLKLIDSLFSLNGPFYLRVDYDFFTLSSHPRLSSEILYAFAGIATEIMYHVFFKNIYYVVVVEFHNRNSCTMV